MIPTYTKDFTVSPLVGEYYDRSIALEMQALALEERVRQEYAGDQIYQQLLVRAIHAKKQQWVEAARRRVEDRLRQDSEFWSNDDDDWEDFLPSGSAEKLYGRTPASLFDRLTYGSRLASSYVQTIDQGNVRLPIHIGYVRLKPDAQRIDQAASAFSVLYASSGRRFAENAQGISWPGYRDGLVVQNLLEVGLEQYEQFRFFMEHASHAYQAPGTKTAAIIAWAKQEASELTPDINIPAYYPHIALHLLLKHCGEQELLPLLRKARMNDPMALVSLQRRIDTVCGRGTYARLGELEAGDKRSVKEFIKKIHKFPRNMN